MHANGVFNIAFLKWSDVPYIAMGIERLKYCTT
jgi:hypothetical protein